MIVARPWHDRPPPRSSFRPSWSSSALARQARRPRLPPHPAARRLLRRRRPCRWPRPTRRRPSWSPATRGSRASSSRTPTSSGAAASIRRRRRGPTASPSRSRSAGAIARPAASTTTIGSTRWRRMAPW